jgi:2'-5' RNA ligase
MSSQIVRTFLGFQLPPALRPLFAEWQRRAGQTGNTVDLEMLHLTLCVVGETFQRDLFLKNRVIAALGTPLPPAAPIRLGRVHSRAMGAELVTRGPAHEIRAFFEAIAALLGAYGIEPMHRMSGLRPHITLGYDRALFDAFNVIRHWTPEELLLIESRPRPGGKGREHIVLHRWPLLPPAQSAFAFMAEDLPAPPMPPLLCAA